jgi:hypothetical protein
MKSAKTTLTIGEGYLKDVGEEEIGRMHDLTLEEVRGRLDDLFKESPHENYVNTTNLLLQCGSETGAVRFNEILLERGLLTEVPIKAEKKIKFPTKRSYKFGLRMFLRKDPGGQVSAWPAWPRDASANNNAWLSEFKNLVQDFSELNDLFKWFEGFVSSSGESQEEKQITVKSLLNAGIEWLNGDQSTEPKSIGDLHKDEDDEDYVSTTNWLKKQGVGLSVKQATDLLIEKGHLEEIKLYNGKSIKYPTEKGFESLGIRARASRDGETAWPVMDPNNKELFDVLNKMSEKENTSDFLPPVKQLTDDQVKAMSSDVNKSMIVTGPPGSGKTVVSLYRVDKLKNERRAKVDIFVYSKVLFSYLSKSLKKLNIIKTNKKEVKTFHSWFCSWYVATFSTEPPPSGVPFGYDWNKVREDFVKSDVSKFAFDQLIIDEAQDIPLQFFKFAARLSKAHTVFADDNQALFESNSTVREIRKALIRYEPELIRLTENHRNSLQIAELANCFAVKGIESGTAKLPERPGELPQLCEGTEEKYRERIINYSKTHKTERIGVFLKTKKQVESWYQALKKKSKRPVQRYYYDKEIKLPPPDFTEYGIFLVTFLSSKGLEFNAVYIPEIDNLRNDDATKMNLYVALSRPRGSLSLHHVKPLPASHVFERNLADERLIDRIKLGDVDDLEI